LAAAQRSPPKYGAIASEQWAEMPTLFGCFANRIASEALHLLGVRLTAIGAQ